MNDNQESKLHLVIKTGKHLMNQMQPNFKKCNAFVLKVFQKIKQGTVCCIVQIRQREVLTLRKEQKDKVKHYIAQAIKILNKIYAFIKKNTLQGIQYIIICLRFFYKEMIMKGMYAFQCWMRKRKQLALQKEYVEKIRICFVSDVDKEEMYLHEKSLQGLHFVKKVGVRYVFKRGKQASYYYHVSYQEHEYVDEQAHIQLFTQKGWQHIFQEKAGLHGVWHYFCVQTIHKPSIDFDVNSNVALYTRLLASMRMLIIMIAACFMFTIYLLFILMTRVSSIQLYAIAICWIVFICLFISLFIYGYLYHKTNLKLQYIMNM